MFWLKRLFRKQQTERQLDSELRLHLMFISVAALLTSVALLACAMPARRAMRVSPTVALRCE